MATTKNPPTIVTCGDNAQDLTLDTNVVSVHVAIVASGTGTAKVLEIA